MMHNFKAGDVVKIVAQPPQIPHPVVGKTGVLEEVEGNRCIFTELDDDGCPVATGGVPTNCIMAELGLPALQAKAKFEEKRQKMQDVANERIRMFAQGLEALSVKYGVKPDVLAAIFADVSALQEKLPVPRME